MGTETEKGCDAGDLVMEWNGALSTVVVVRKSNLRSYYYRTRLQCCSSFIS